MIPSKLPTFKQWPKRILAGVGFGVSLVLVHHYKIKPDELALAKDVFYFVIGGGAGVWRPKPAKSGLDPAILGKLGNGPQEPA